MNVIKSTPLNRLKSLSPFDDKRYILEDGFTTQAHGHYENEIARPSTKVSELDEAMKGLSISKDSTPKSETPKSETPQQEHLTVEHVSATANQELPPLAPLPSDLINTGLHSYLTSFWN